VLQLLIASLMVALTIVMHLSGLALLLALMRPHRRRLKVSHARVHQLIIIFGAASGLFALHTLEIWAYAALYVQIQALPTFDDALYFSTTTYSTLGYGDVILPRAWRIVGAIEGANGIILLGWSTAFFFSVIERIRLFERDVTKDDGQ
jgi:voltage-gated potassium channel